MGSSSDVNSLDDVTDDTNRTGDFYRLDVCGRSRFGGAVNILLNVGRTMNCTLVLLVTLVLCEIPSSSVGAEANSSDSVLAGIKTRFDPNAVLSRDELLSVVALARDCGVSDVAEVYTQNIHPTSAYGIGVKSRETVRGRNISFVNVIMDYEKFSSKKYREMSRVFNTNGQFWVNQGCIIPVSQTTFVVHGNTIRVGLSDNTPLPVADKIVAGFATGKIRYATEKLKKEVERKGVDLSKPTGVSLNKDGKTFGASFSLGDLAGMHLTFTFEEDVVTVSDVAIWVS